jgi:hypothetical protein
LVAALPRRRREFLRRHQAQRCAEDQGSRIKQLLLVFGKKAIASRHYNPKVEKVEKCED